MTTLDYFDAIHRSGADYSGENYRYYLSQITRGVDFAGKRVLDIGGGGGNLSLYAVSQGAALGVCLEPEAHGSSVGMHETFERTAAILHTGDRARLVCETIQDFVWDGEHFDLILLHNSINHLDEQATERLHRDEKARETFRAIFRKIGDLAVPGARMLIADCDRYNVWRVAPGVTNPFAPTIEWHTHQPPERWAAVARAGGFETERVIWTSLNTLREPGRLLLGNRLAAYLLRSHFAMWLRKH